MYQQGRPLLAIDNVNIAANKFVILHGETPTQKEISTQETSRQVAELLRRKKIRITTVHWSLNQAYNLIKRI